MVSFTVVVMASGEFGYMTTIEPAEKLNNWSQLASTGNMVRYVVENLVSLTGMAAKVQGAAAGNALCQEAIERMNRILSAQYHLIDPDVISLGGSISQNLISLSKGFKKQWTPLWTDMKNIHNCSSHSKPAPTRQMPISMVPLSTGYRRRINGKFYPDLVPNKPKLLKS